VPAFERQCKATAQETLTSIDSVIGFKAKHNTLHVYRHLRSALASVGNCDRRRSAGRTSTARGRWSRNYSSRPQQFAFMFP
jgi:hypothetical protein